MKGSFSIDSLLAKKKDEASEQTSPTSLTSQGNINQNHLSPRISSDCSSNTSTPSPESRLSPDIQTSRPFLKNGLIPRPGLLNAHHQAMLQSNPAAIQGLLQAQYLNALHGQSSGHSHLQQAQAHVHHGLNGSAFHSPSEHAFKMAQVQAAQAQSQNIQPYLSEWMSRGGMLMSRMMDYTGEETENKLYDLALLHPERPKLCGLYGVLAVLSAIGLESVLVIVFIGRN